MNIKTRTAVFIALCLIQSVSLAATPASCTDTSGKALPAEACMGAASPSAQAPSSSQGFAGRKSLVLKNMRHAEGVIRKAISCAEKARNDDALTRCAK